MLRLALRTLWFRAGLFVASLLVMLFAAAIMMACGGLIETGVRTAVPPRQLTSADIVVAGDQEYHDSGGDPDEPPILPERVRIDAGLERTIAGLDGVRTTKSYVFEGEAPPGTVDAIGVEAKPGQDVAQLRKRIDAVVGDRTITLVGDERGRAELRDAQASGVTVMALAGVFTAFTLLVSIFGVASMLGLSIAQRRRDMALLRAVGATPRQVRRLIFRETLMLSVVATAVAYVPGHLLGRFLFDQLADRGIAAHGIAFHQGWIPTVAATAVAIVAALAGALLAGRRAARIKPTQALAEVGVEARYAGVGRMILGWVLLAGAFALTMVTIVVMSGPLTPATGAPAVILLGLGFALLAPGLTRITTFVLQWPVHALGGVTGQLAILNARGRSSRMAAVMAPVILLTTVSVGMLYLQTTNDKADRRAFADNLVADAVLTIPGGVDPDLVHRINDLPGVAGASEYVNSLGFIEKPQDRSPMNEGWTLQGVTAEGAGATTPVKIAEGAFAGLRGDTIAIEGAHAHRLGVGVGDPITLRMGDNTALDVRVAALFSAPDGYDTLLLPADTLAAHTTEGVATRILVKANNDTSTTQLVERLDGAAVAAGATVGGRDVLLKEYDDEKRTANFAIYLMVLVIAGYAAITVTSTLASSVTARRREFGLQRLAGSTRTQVMQMVGLEGTLVALSGVVIGSAAAAVILVPVSLKRLGSVVPAGGPWIFIALALFTLLLTLSAVLLPAWRATHRRPAEAALAVE